MAVVGIAVVSIALVSIAVIRIAVVSIVAVSIAEPHHVMRLQCSNLQLSCGSSSACHLAPVRPSGSQHCDSKHCGSQHCGSQHCGAASCHAAPLLGRVETKIFVFVFISFKNTNLFAKTFAKTKIFTKKKIFTKSKNDSAPCDYGSATLLTDIVILCNFNMLMKWVSFGLKWKPLFPSENKQKFARFSQNFVTRKYSFSPKFSRKIVGSGWFSWKVFVLAKKFHENFLFFDSFCENFRFGPCFCNHFVLEAFRQKQHFFNWFSGTIHQGFGAGYTFS
jgi:hypothetical protein